MDGTCDELPLDEGAADRISAIGMVAGILTELFYSGSPSIRIVDRAGIRVRSTWRDVRLIAVERFRLSFSYEDSFVVIRKDAVSVIRIET